MRSERKKRRSFLARFMVLMMIINLLSGINPNVARAAGADEQHFANNGKEVNDTDGVKLKETASGYNDGKFNVELLVNGSGSTTTQTKNLDVVLVVDRSNSMNKNNRMENAKNAATAFVNNLLKNNGGDNVRVGLVSYAGNKSDVNSDPVLDFEKLQKNKQNLINVISKYTAYGNGLGGTFTQAGLRKANDLFDNNTNKKIIVLISDGEPTYAYSAGQVLDFNQIHRAYSDTPEAGYEIWSRGERHNGSDVDKKSWKKGYKTGTYETGSLWWEKTWNWTPYYVKLVPDPEVVGDGKHMNTIIQNNTISEATAIKNSGVEVFSVGIGVNDFGKYVLSQVASQNRYYDSNTYASDLAKILKELHNVIINCNIVNGSLEIQMNDKVDFKNETNFSDLSVEVVKTNYDAVSQEERDSFDKRKAEIKNKNNWNWNSNSKVLTLKNITLGEKEELKVTYKAELKEEWKDGTPYPLSQTAKLNLKALTDSDNRAVNFIIPTVKDEKTVNLKVNKTWDGKVPESVANGITFKVNPSPDGKQLQVTVKPNGWSGELNDIPKYKNGEAITYTISEPVSSDYKVISPEPANGQLSGTKDDAGNWKFDVKNKNTEKTSLVVIKNWVTADGKEAPADLKFAAKVQLYADGKKVDKQAAFDNNGKAEFTGLDKYNSDSSLINYTVKEVNEKGEEESSSKIKNGKFNYEVTYKYDNNSAVVTNKVTNPEARTFNVNITKTWKGGVGEKAVFTFTNGTKTEKEELTKAKFGNKETWTATKSLQKYNNDGSKAVYRVTETADGFETELTTTKVDFESPVVGATNTRETTKVTAKKIWSENTPADLKFDVKVQLYADGKAVKGKAATIKADGTSSQVTFDGLPKKNLNGTEIQYSVKELDSTGTGVEHNQTITNGEVRFKVTYDANQSGELVITNTCENPEAKTFEITLKKNWVGGVGNKAEFVFTNSATPNKPIIETLEKSESGFGGNTTWTKKVTLPKYNNNGTPASYTVKESAKGFISELNNTTVDSKTTTVEATNTREKTSVKVTKIWSENTPADLKFEVKVKLYANGNPVNDGEATIAKGKTETTFTNLPEFDEAGNKITYSVKELNNNQPVDEGGKITKSKVDFTVNYKAITADNVLEITNTCENPQNETFKVTLKKIWKDGVGKEAKFTFTSLSDTAKKHSVTLERSKFAPNNTTWTDTTELPMYDDKGNSVQYTVQEAAKGFKSVTVVEDGKVDATHNTVTATNTRDTIKKVTVTKNWSTNTPSDLKFNVTVQLYADGAPSKKAVIKKGEDTAVFENLPKTDLDGKVINYTVKELDATGKALDNNETFKNGDVKFTVTYDGSAEKGFTILNKCENPEAEKFTVKLTKIWVGGVGKSADFVFTGKVGGTIKESLAGAANLTTWTGEVKLPKYDKDGKEESYTVSESAIGYTSKVDKEKISSTDTEVTATNTRITTAVKAIKEWETTPEELKFDVTVQLFADDKAVADKTAVITKGSTDAVNFEGLDKYDSQGKEIKYTVKELDADKNAVDNNGELTNSKFKFTVTYSGNAADGFKIVNKCENPEAEKFTVKLTKTWVNGVGEKAEFVFKDLAGKETTEQLSKNNLQGETWQANISLPKYNAEGKEEVYTVTEKEVPGFTSKPNSATVDSKNTDLEVTNTRNTDTYTIKKVWADNTPKDLIQDVNVYLKGTIADKTEVVSETAIISKNMASEGKAATFTVPTHDLAGNEITYTASEEGQNGDKVTINNEPFKVAITPNGKNFTITNTYDGFASNKISVTLKKEWVGDKRDKATFTFNDKEVTLTKAENWEKEVELPKYDSQNGNEITYKVKETVIPGYKTTLAVNGDPISGYNPAEAYGVVNEDVVTFTNTQITRKLTVKKVWVGTASEAAFTLAYKYNNDNKSEQLNLAKGTTELTKELPVYDVDGKPVEYTVTEKALEGYQLKEGPQTFEFVDPTGAAGPENKVLTFTNTKQLENKFTVHKTWVGKVASRVSFGLFNGSEKVDELALTDANAVAVSANVWTGTFTKYLPSDNASGPITYVVKELDASGNPVEDGNAVELGGVRYKVEGTQAQAAANIYNFTNTELKDVTVTKTWEGTLPNLTSAVNFGLYKDVNGVLGKVDNVNPVVTPNNNNNANEWIVTFKDVVAVETSGTAITYSIKELNADGQPVSDTVKIGDNKYKVSYDDNGNIKNTELIDITVEKKWEKDYAFVPDSEDYSVEVAVFDNAGKPVEKMTATLPHKDDDGKLIWKHTFENLPYIEGGYKVKETHINGESIDKFANLFKSETDPESIDKTGDVTITNSFNIPNPGPDKLNVTKYWEAGATKAAIKVQAFYKVGGKWVAASEATEMNQTGDIWSTEITPVKPNTPSGEASGTAINPAPVVETAESEANQPEANQPEADKTAPDANAPEAPVTDGESASPVVKAQSENENALEGVETAPEMPSGSFEDIDFSEAKSTIYNPMAEYYVIETYIDGEDGGELTDEEIQTLLSNTGTDGKTSYKLGKYDVVVQKLSGNKTYIRNMLSVKTTRIRVEKDWKNTPDSYKKDVQVKLYKEKTGISDIANALNTDNNLQDTAKDTEPELEEVTGVAPLTITKGDSWLGYFNGLPKYDEDGKIIQYHVAEVKIGDLTKDPVTLGAIEAGYEIGQYDVKIVGDGTEDVKVENTIKRIDVNAVKTWAAGTTKVQVEFTLYAKDGDTFKKATDSAIIAVADTMKTTFTGVPKFDENGNEISYYVFETKIIGVNTVHNNSDKYETVVTGGTYTTEITNNGYGGKDVISINNSFRATTDEPVPSDPGTTPGTDPGTTPGTDPGTTPGTTPGTDPGANPNQDTTTIDVPTDDTPQGDAVVDDADDDADDDEDDLVEIDEDDIPQGDAKVEDDVEVTEDKTPEGPVQLPKTGGTAGDFLSLIGMGLLGLGLVFKKKRH